MDGYRAYTPNMPAHGVAWADPDVNFISVNESFNHRNDIKRSDYMTNDNIYKTNEFNETNAKNRIAYSMTTVSSYMYLPFYGTMQQSPATSSVIWQQSAKQKRFLSSDATPFIPAKSDPSKRVHLLLFVSF